MRKRLDRPQFRLQFREQFIGRALLASPTPTVPIISIQRNQIADPAQLGFRQTPRPDTDPVGFEYSEALMRFSILTLMIATVFCALVVASVFYPIYAPLIPIFVLVLIVWRLL